MDGRSQNVAIFREKLMIGNLNHIAIAVPDLEAASKLYQDVFGVFISSPRDLPEHGVRIVMVKLANTTLELMTPLGENSPIQNFLKRNPQGGIHHVCYEVPDLETAREALSKAGIDPLGDGKPKLGYHGNPVIFFNPKASQGVLIELQETDAAKRQSHVEISRIGPAHKSKQSDEPSLRGSGGVGIDVEVDFRLPTPQDNEEQD